MPPLSPFNKTAITLALSQVITLPVQAATITVDTINDTLVAGTCSLRAAIQSANDDTGINGCSAGNNHDTIDLSNLPNGSEITLTDTLPTIISGITINGRGQNNLSISGSYSHRILEVENGGNLTVSSLSLINGRAPVDDSGAAILVDNAILTVNNSTLSHNISGSSTSNRLGNGGAIHADNNSTLTIHNSTVAYNLAGSRGFGGGVSVDNDTKLEITNSTVSNNSLSQYGGGVSVFDSSMTMSNSTVSDNYSYSGGGIYASGSSLIITNSTLTENYGAGIYTRGSNNIEIHNSIVAGNMSVNYFFAEELALYGDINITDRNNLIGDNHADTYSAFTTFIPHSSNIIGTSDQLNLPLSQIIEPLADNGGTTLTHALVSGSPAIANANFAKCPTTDQTGAVRSDVEDFFVPIVLQNKKIAVVDLGGVASDECDIGAVEFE